MLHTPLPITINTIDDPILQEKKVSLKLLRLDQSDPFISGNKWFKLKYNLEDARNKHYTSLLTFGGAYSNHIHATAAAAKRFHFKSIGVIRGEKSTPLNNTLKEAQQLGMFLHFVDRKNYRLKTQAYFQQQLIDTFSDEFGKIVILPEGGSNHLAVKGCAEIIELIDVDYQFLCCPCGSGGTLAGLISGLNQQQQTINSLPTPQIIGFSALKGGDFLQNDVMNLLNETHQKSFSSNINWQVNARYHFGGFAKTTPELLDFIQQFYQQHQIKLDYVYTGKMLYAIFDLVKSDYFPTNTTIVAIHTGGLQGNQKINF